MLRLTFFKIFKMKKVKNPIKRGHDPIIKSLNGHYNFTENPAKSKSIMMQLI